MIAEMKIICHNLICLSARYPLRRVIGTTAILLMNIIRLRVSIVSLWSFGSSLVRALKIIGPNVYYAIDVNFAQKQHKIAMMYSLL